MRTLLLLIASIFLFENNFAQNIELSASLDTTQIRIGEQTTYRITASGVRDASKLSWPEIKDTLHSKIEVIEVLPVDTLNSGQFMDLQLPILITSWDSGFYAIHPIAVQYEQQDLMTEAMLLSVNTLPVDTAQAPIDIKTIYEEELSFSEWISPFLPYLIGLLAALIIFYFVFKAKRNSEVDVFGKDPDKTLPAHEIALKKLSEIKSEELAQNHDKKKFYSQLTETIRTYLEDRYNVNALEQTSAETLEGMKYLGIPSESMDYLRSLLLTSDMVKFAKEVPSTSVAAQHLAAAYQFIEQTKSIQKSEEDE